MGSSLAVRLPTGLPTSQYRAFRANQTTRRNGPWPVGPWTAWTTGRRRRPSGVALGREQVARPQREPELHPVERAREVAPRELLDLPHPVPERVAVDEELGGGRLPPGVVLQERLQRPDQLPVARPVVGV